KVKVWGSIKRL
nr:Chain A, Superoxide dismutase [Cu-Zn] [Homo sapiens]5WOR_B Chain B, Superoxide dismutase [Cu-Zn] [Homo sapiens]5WOR_C Chain C, Superoxide dismutase [Cu-Zn] [Homo sapiens]5WOR_D Chain D, Superoxide dismutase [Cu-Zn] [Homo sapiens]5WOR_E Chain E, Superoxide dismutase [Cu-Zn] [Homo sapiens]5WOR_F Chain F, Superoxide dismutase [Cu-Zn] [Homo sapiens]5WOR_G Chain G, Superoxide dismutase [Cu-Zn] [Homo sapiens]5WOR_H Chain H, Superoxide dismutase [Cu-Zn] [Homo sapiens]5WOR_I Chain I, Superoxide 